MFCNVVNDFHHCVVTESDRWTPEEVDRYHQGLVKYDKDFFTIAKQVQTEPDDPVFIYNTVDPFLKDTLQRGHPSRKDKFLATSAMNACNAPSHQRTPNKDKIVCQQG